MIEEVACTGAYACTANDGTQCSQGGVVWLAEECRMRDAGAGVLGTSTSPCICSPCVRPGGGEIILHDTYSLHVHRGAPRCTWSEYVLRSIQMEWG